MQNKVSEEDPGSDRRHRLAFGCARLRHKSVRPVLQVCAAAIGAAGGESPIFVVQQSFLRYKEERVGHVVSRGDLMSIVRSSNSWMEAEMYSVLDLEESACSGSQDRRYVLHVKYNFKRRGIFAVTRDVIRRTVFAPAVQIWS